MSTHRKYLAMGLLALAALGCEAQPLVVADGPDAQFAKAGDTCTTIQSGTLKASDGSVIPMGFDVWGYNYQAHLFTGGYCDAYRDAAWCQDYKEDALAMKWNEAWLSNKDCDGDSKLDRHHGFPGYIGSGAWLTNRQSGSYVDNDGQTVKWNYFVKIVAAPADATNVGGVWYAADGTEIGAVIWNEFAVIQEVYNDPGTGDHGLLYGSPAGPGFGNFKPLSRGTPPAPRPKRGRGR